MTQPIYDYDNGSVYVRLDANPSIGFGHLFRCLSVLAQCRADSITFLTRDPTEIQRHTDNIGSQKLSILAIAAETLIADEAHWIQNNIPIADRRHAILLVDSYGHQALASQFSSLFGLVVQFDDFGQPARNIDYVINSAASKINYRGLLSLETGLVTGLDNALVRSEFLVADPESTRVNRIFVCFGGADPDNLLDATLHKLNSDSSNAQAALVVLPFHHDIEEWRCNHPNSIEFRQQLSAQEMAQTMQSCNTAIVACSTTALECIATGTPPVVVHYVENQKMLAQSLRDVGIVVTGSNAAHIVQLANSPAPDSTISVRNMLRKAPSKWQKRWQEWSIEARLSIRAATSEDVTAIYELANHPSVRSMSINQQSIPFDDHVRWFTAKLTDDSCYFLVLELDGKFASQIRLQLEKNSTWSIHYSVIPKFRGLGIGRSTVRRALKMHQFELENTPDCSTIDTHYCATVGEQNIASAMIFESLGFEELAPSRDDSVVFRHFKK